MGFFLYMSTEYVIHLVSTSKIQILRFWLKHQLSYKQTPIVLHMLMTEWLCLVVKETQSNNARLRVELMLDALNLQYLIQMIP